MLDICLNIYKIVLMWDNIKNKAAKFIDSFSVISMYDWTVLVLLIIILLNTL